MSAKFSVYRKIEDSPEVAIHGRVYTKQHIVDLILDLAGYTADKYLKTLTLLDPGCGTGAFVATAAKRLLATCQGSDTPDEIAGCLLAVEKDAEVAESCRELLAEILRDHGYSKRDASKLANSWVVCGDFLEKTTDRTFDFVVGNPPYVRQEAIPKEAVLRYREIFTCFYDRADLYVAFLEKGLSLLSANGTLGFICPNRFTRNRYGSKIREVISEKFQVRQVIDLPEASPFEPAVMSYPGIYVIGRGKTAEVDHIRLTDANEAECDKAKSILQNKSRQLSANGVSYFRYKQWFSGEQQWSMESPAHLKLLRRLESECVPLGDSASGCRVGIGVASGADSIFLVDKDAEVEPELLMPIATTQDIKSGQVEWSGRYIVNPFKLDDSGQLIDLSKYPLVKKYFDSHKEQLCGRNVAKRNSKGWYRTIDRIYPTLQKQRKLLIPDIKADNLIVYENGKLYPHHNLYFVTSGYWNLFELQTILRSSLAKFFVWMYGVKMRSSFLRFQAQYLRKICIPDRMMVTKEGLNRLAKHRDSPLAEINEVIADAYGLSKSERKLIEYCDS